MAPCNFNHEYNLQMTNKEKNKLRKPLVEKMRRDRINSSIEQLKSLLEKEFQKNEPNSKLEKADVLEMTVNFLKQQMRPQVDYDRGYSRCLQETLQFLSLCAPHKEAGARLIRHFNGSPKIDDTPSCPAVYTVHKQKPSEVPTTLWRPWQSL
ncbi:transcription factor HES-5-like [Polypterus senegalus]|uniref:transcription factor HES-5-like n=1 Tax=Polypterus senegalus TaxID=55291 RepID=UPI00196317BB|nr:transcription factor HES-5-like [Polypterus senegalus]